MLEFKNMDQIYEIGNKKDHPGGKRKRSLGNLITVISAAFFILLSLGIIIFLYNQNQSLKDKLSEYLSLPSPSPITIFVTPSPSATSSASLEERSFKYNCPENGFVNCMPGPDLPEDECSKEALDWFKENCPDFKGAAY